MLSDLWGLMMATATTKTQRARSSMALAMAPRTMIGGGKAYTTSRWGAPHTGQLLEAQSRTDSASTASAPGSGKRLQKRAARALDVEAKASTVMRHC